MRIILFVITATISLIPLSVAHAYIGPGLGAGTIGVILGIIGSLLLALFAVVWYPIKRLLKKIKLAKSDSASSIQDKEVK